MVPSRCSFFVRSVGAGVSLNLLFDSFGEIRGYPDPAVGYLRASTSSRPYEHRSCSFLQRWHARALLSKDIAPPGLKGKISARTAQALTVVFFGWLAAITLDDYDEDNANGVPVNDGFGGLGEGMSTPPRRIPRVRNSGDGARRRDSRVRAS